MLFNKLRYVITKILLKPVLDRTYLGNTDATDTSERLSVLDRMMLFEACGLS